MEKETRKDRERYKERPSPERQAYLGEMSQAKRRVKYNESKRGKIRVGVGRGAGWAKLTSVHEFPHLLHKTWSNRRSHTFRPRPG